MLSLSIKVDMMEEVQNNCSSQMMVFVTHRG